VSCALTISYDGWIWYWIYHGNMDDEKWEQYATNFLFTHRRRIRNKYIFWDNLGKSGRCKNPNTIHFNQNIKQKLFNQYHCTPIHIPRYCPLLNPAELANSFIVHFVKKQKRDTAKQIEQAIKDGISQITPEMIQGWFHERATGHAY
jgi:hypothetical protein